ncbi:MAG: ATP-binding cassette domain-containing protein, partial [Patescibacteria group bacterium]
MIVIKNLSATIYGKSLFENLDVVVRPGEKVGIIGQNGSGKSTLLKLIAGQIEPDEGTITLDHEIVGYLPQSIDAANNTTIENYLDLPSYP